MTVEINDKEEIINILNDLIVMNHGIVNVYQTAAEHLNDESNIELMHEFIEQHETFAAELSNLVANYSGNPVRGADAGSFAQRIWVGLKAVTTEGDGPILTEVADEAKKVLTAYGEAMGSDLPDDARDLIREQIGYVRITSEKLTSLSAAYQS